MARRRLPRRSPSLPETCSGDGEGGEGDGGVAKPPGSPCGSDAAGGGGGLTVILFRNCNILAKIQLINITWLSNNKLDYGCLLNFSIILTERCAIGTTNLILILVVTSFHQVAIRHSQLTECRDNTSTSTCFAGASHSPARTRLYQSRDFTRHHPARPAYLLSLVKELRATLFCLDLFFLSELCELLREGLTSNLAVA
jgi:hypothetical protein